MGFDTQGFQRAPWEHRTQEVPVPELAEFFTDGSPAVFKVRGLSADELYKIRFSVSRHLVIEGIAEGLAEASKSGATRAINEVLSTSQLHPATPRAIETLIFGCVDPPCDLDMARLLMSKHGVVFMKLSDTIMTLAGLGGEVAKKAEPSGQSPV